MTMEQVPRMGHLRPANPPNPYAASLVVPVAEEIAEAVRLARAEMRERCAQIAAAYNDVGNIAFCIAADIRALEL